MAPGGMSSKDKGASEVVTDLWQLCRDYAKQEMVDPLKSLKRLMAFGIPGGLLLALGIGFGALAVLRGLQTELDRTLDGNYDFVPYLAALVFTAVAIVLSVVQIKRPYRAQEKQR